jgi:CrcB protein
MQMRLILLVALGGGVGSVLRYGVNLAGYALVGAGFPWWTLAVNVLGSFAMGLIAAFLLLRGGSDEWRALLATGVLGGFTTFSAFSLDFAELVERGEHLNAAGYAAASVALSIAAVFAGLSLARAVF